MKQAMRFVAAACLVLWAADGFTDEPKAAELNQLRLYVPIPEFKERFGEDVDPLAAYVKALQAKTNQLIGKEKKGNAKGLLVAVGIKSKNKTRVWCQAVEGTLPSELIDTIEKELASVEGIDLKQAPAGFAMELKLFGQKPKKYPEFPDAWVKAAKKDKPVKLVPPDDLFDRIWAN